ncbi:MAG: hypothetical protein V8S76_00580 [Lachnospiraceae bacterium]
MKQKMIYDLALEYTRGQGQFSGSSKLSGSYTAFVNNCKSFKEMIEKDESLQEIFK